jgi:hypothetical protein
MRLLKLVFPPSHALPLVCYASSLVGQALIDFTQEKAALAL